MFFVVGPAAGKRMPAGLWVVLCACQAARVGAAWVQGRHFTAFGGRGGVLRADVKKPRWWRSAAACDAGSVTMERGRYSGTAASLLVCIW